MWGNKVSGLISNIHVFALLSGVSEYFSSTYSKITLCVIWPQNTAAYCLKYKCDSLYTEFFPWIILKLRGNSKFCFHFHICNVFFLNCEMLGTDGN